MARANLIFFEFFFLAHKQAACQALASKQRARPAHSISRARFSVAYPMPTLFA